MRNILIVLIALCVLPIAVAQSSGSAASTQSVTVTLTSAQLQRLASSPVQFAPAPGAGQMIYVLSSMAQYKAGSAPYVAQSGRLNVYTGNSGNTAGATPALGFLDKGTSQVRLMGAPSSGDPQSSYENQALMVTNDGATEWTNGDGTITMTVYYTVVALQ